MKKTILCLIALCTFATSFAQSEKYVTAMKANLAAFDTSFKKPEYLLSLANNFERIAKAEKTQWLPYYYAALCHINYAFLLNKPAENDAIADRATKDIQAADSLSANNSELSLLKAMAASVRMIVNPMERYMQYGMMSETEMQKAIAQDSTNPRPYYFKGTMLKHTPEQFGGGCKAAMEFLTKALAKFDTFKPTSELHPNWGKAQAELYILECK